MIYDAQAATSIRMWSLFALGHENPASRRFDWWHVTDSAGNGYPEVLGFYRTVWRYGWERAREELTAAAKQLQDYMRDETNLARPRVTAQRVARRTGPSEPPARSADSCGCGTR